MWFIRTLKTFFRVNVFLVLRNFWHYVKSVITSLLQFYPIIGCQLFTFRYTCWYLSKVVQHTACFFSNVQYEGIIMTSDDYKTGGKVGSICNWCTYISTLYFWIVSTAPIQHCNFSYYVEFSLFQQIKMPKWNKVDWWKAIFRNSKKMQNTVLRINNQNVFVYRNRQENLVLNKVKKSISKKMYSVNSTDDYD